MHLPPPFWVGPPAKNNIRGSKSRLVRKNENKNCRLKAKTKCESVYQELLPGREPRRVILLAGPAVNFDVKNIVHQLAVRTRANSDKCD
jgi:hypothetical protein